MPSTLENLVAAQSLAGEPPAAAASRLGTIVDIVDARAATMPTAPFLTTIEDGLAMTMTYGDLGRRTLDAATTWAQTNSASVVGVVPRNDSDSIVAILGLLRAGCQVLLINPADPIARMQAQATAAEAAAILAPPFAGLLGDRVPAPTSGHGLDLPSPTGDALLFGTSGSSAASKLVVQSHLNVTANAAGVIAHHRLRPGDRVLGCLPIHHVNGLHFTVIAIIAAGAHVLLAPRFDPLAYPSLMREFQPRLASVVPTVLETLVEMWRGDPVPHTFEYFVSAAAPLQAETARAVSAVLGARVNQGYGLTETTNFSTTMPLRLDAALRSTLTEGADVPSIGIAVQGNEVVVQRKDGSPAGPEESGEICVRGHNVMAGYAGNPKATGQAVRDGWLHTEDIGFFIDHRQRFFFLTGRSKNIAKVKGETVSLEEVERALRRLPDLADAACVAMPDRLSGEKLVALLVIRDDAGVPDLGLALRELLARNAIPQQVVTVAEIPRTPTGKIRRSQLADLVPMVGG